MLSRSIVPERLRSSYLSIPDQYQYLLVVMGLPLVDGVFLSIVLTGGLNSVADSLMVGSFVLGGGATIGVVLSEFDDNIWQSIRITLVICAAIAAGAALQAMFASVIAPFIDTQMFSYGAILALLILSIKIIPNDKLDVPISPTLVVGMFLILSIDPTGISEVGTVEYNLVAAGYAVLAVSVAAGTSVTAIVLRPLVADKIDPKVLKYATSMGLIAIMLSIIGIVPSLTAPVAFSATAVLSYIGL